MFKPDYNLFQILKEDYRKNNRIFFVQPSSWWSRKIGRIENDILSRDFSNFRGFDPGMNVGFSDGSPLDMRHLNTKRQNYLNFFQLKIWKQKYDQQIFLTKKYYDTSFKLMSFFYEQNANTKYLLKSYNLNNTAKFGCVKKIKIKNKFVSFSAIEMVNKIDLINNTEKLKKTLSYCEIGGGFGLNTQLIAQNFKNIKKFLYIDIYPTIFYGTNYLKKIFGKSVIDYTKTKKLNEIKFKNDKSLEIICIPNWEIDKLNMKIDHFHNSYSFTEMSEKIITKYIEVLKKLNTEVSSLCFYPFSSSSSIQPIKIERIIKIYKKFGYKNITSKNYNNVLNLNKKSDKLLIIK